MSDTRVSDPIPATMAYPDPIELPDKFLSHLQSLELEVATLIFQHFQTRPLQAADGRLDAPSAQEWCERMDNLLGKLGRFKGAHPEQSDLYAQLTNICTKATLEVETAVLIQEKEDDDARKEEAEKAERLERERKEVADAERDLDRKRQALREAQKDRCDDEEEIDEDEDNEGSESLPDEQPEKAKKQTKGRTEQGPRSKLQQVAHPSPCQLCLQKKVVCSGPIGQACDVCAKQKRSCSNGGRRREVTVKEEPKSPAQAAGRKRKAKSTTDSNPITVIDGPIDVDFSFDPPVPPVRKRSKTAPVSTPRVHFDGAEAQTSTTKSTRSAAKKDLRELFKRLGEEYDAVSKTFEQIADMVD